VYVSAVDTGVALSCAGRLLAERARGESALVVCVGTPSPDDSAEGSEFQAAMGRLRADSFFWGDAPQPEPPLSESLSGRATCPEDRLFKLAAGLDDIRRRTRPRHVYLPLGVGGTLAERAIHEAGLQVFGGGGTRDVFFYEERPVALIPGAVRLRLAQIAASLPPGASRVRGASLLRILLGFQRAPYLRGRLRKWSERFRTALALTRQWESSRAWRPQRAFGLRLQPLLQEVDPDAREMATVFASRFPRVFGTAERLALATARYSRSLGHEAPMERYWLLLPQRENLGAVVRGLSTAAEGRDLISPPDVEPHD
jgi:hypothetical protein